MFVKRKDKNGKIFHICLRGAILLFWLLAIMPSFAADNTRPYLSIGFNHSATVCELDALPTVIDVANQTRCTETSLGKVNPQGKLLLVSLTIDIPTAFTDGSFPVGLFVFGKNASHVYLNDTFLGANGMPAHDHSEIAGQMDTVYFVPENSLTKGTNQLSFVMSAQHSLVELGNPLHFVAVGIYQSPQSVIQEFSEIGLILIGVFLLGAVYFSALWFYRRERKPFALFALMCIIAALQLGAEIFRGLFSYPYPMHDVRLIVITACSVVFGLSLLFYTVSFSRSKHALFYFTMGTLVTLSAVFFVPGFDFKTLLALIIPMCHGLVLSVSEAYKRQRQDLLHWALAQCVFLITSWLATSMFHEFLYYLLVAGLLMFLFYQQARDMAQKQQQQQLDQKIIAKLEYQLAQRVTHQTPTRIEISIGGKVEMIESSRITFCKAAGDYVELILEDGSERLYSGSLKTLETLLPNTFLRVHRSYLVNLSHVESLHAATPTHAARLELKNSRFVDVSRRLLPSVRATITAK